jgi:hypothetical protein
VPAPPGLVFGSCVPRRLAGYAFASGGLAPEVEAGGAGSRARPSVSVFALPTSPDTPSRGSPYSVAAASRAGSGAPVTPSFAWENRFS